MPQIKPIMLHKKYTIVCSKLFGNSLGKAHIIGVRNSADAWGLLNLKSLICDMELHW